MKKNWLFFLATPLAISANEIMVKKGETISHILQRQRLVPIYGKNNFLEQTLLLNNLTLNDAKKIKPGNMIKLPILKENQPQLSDKSKDQDELQSVQTNKADLSFTFGVGTMIFNFSDQSNNKAVIDTSYYLKLKSLISNPINAKLNVNASIDLHALALRLPENLKINKANLLSLGGDLSLGMKQKQIHYYLHLGQEPWWSPISQDQNNLVLSEIASFFAKLSLAYSIFETNTTISYKHYMPRNTNDFDIIKGHQVGLESWFHSPLLDQYHWGVDMNIANRETSLVDEQVYSIFIQVKI